MSKDTAIDSSVRALFDAGTHFAYSKRRRHPSAAPFVVAGKNGNDAFDLAHTAEQIEAAKEFAKSLSKDGKVLLFVGTKPEAKRAVEEAAERLGMPYVMNRWIGGTLTNFSEIKRRIALLEELLEKKETGGLDVYTKKERSLINQEIEDLSGNFSGLVSMKKIPGAMFVIDDKHEKIAVDEAKAVGIPVISLSNSDCDIRRIDYPVSGNDASRTSIEFIVRAIADAFAQGKLAQG